MSKKLENRIVEAVIAFLSVIPDPQFQQIINELASRKFQWHLLKAIRVSKNLGPAMSVGVNFNGPVGLIFLADDLPTNFSSLELKFIVGHEIAHIAKSHVIAKVIVSVFEEWLVELFSEKVVDLFKTLFYMRRQPVLDQKIVRDNELEADKDAIDLVGSKEAGISTLKKLAKFYANGNLDAPSHLVPLGKLEVPAVTFRERITNISSLY